MALWKAQPGFCSVCGKSGEYKFSYNRAVWCSPDCMKEHEWRTVLSIRGKDYYPDPKK